MKVNYLILTLGLLWSQELQVDGDLNVTGDIQSTTIDSLISEISHLNMKIDSLLSTIPIITARTFVTNIEITGETGVYTNIDLNEVVGSNHDFYKVDILNLEGFETENSKIFFFPQSQQTGYGWVSLLNNPSAEFDSDNSTIVLTGDNPMLMYFTEGNPAPGVCSVSMLIETDY